MYVEGWRFNQQLSQEMLSHGRVKKVTGCDGEGKRRSIAVIRHLDWVLKRI